MFTARWIFSLIGLGWIAQSAFGQVPSVQPVVSATLPNKHWVNGPNVITPYTHACQERGYSQNFLGRMGSWFTYRSGQATIEEDCGTCTVKESKRCVAPSPLRAAKCVSTTGPSSAVPVRRPAGITFSLGCLSLNRASPGTTCAKPGCPAVGMPPGNGFAARACDNSFRCGPSGVPNCPVGCPPPGAGAPETTIVATSHSTPVRNWFRCNRSVGVGACSTTPSPAVSGIVNPSQISSVAPEGLAIPLHKPTNIHETVPPP